MKNILVAAAFFCAALVVMAAQAPAPPGAPPVRGGVASFPAQQREPDDPAVVSRGSDIYGLQCRSCHGLDLRGGEMGGPNLLRSAVVLGDQNGELIGPVIQG